MILVTGATGHLGSATLHFLLKKRPASQLVALVRDETKAADLKDKGIGIRVGQYDDITSLDNAMQGIDTVLLIAGTNTDEDQRLVQHQNVVDTAKRAGVQRIAYTGRALRDRNTLVNQLMVGHFQTEDYIKASGLPYTLFQNILYMDAIPQFVGPGVFEQGIYLPAGQGKVAFALRSDMGEAMANAMAADERGNTLYKLTGSAAYSFADVATALTELSGKTVKYTAAEQPAFEAGLKERGLPDVMIQRITDFTTDIKNGQEEVVSHDLEQLLGRKPTSLRDGLKELYKL
jgi:NAD(P)H dehydrogenase (quinone)